MKAENALIALVIGSLIALILWAFSDEYRAQKKLIAEPDPEEGSDETWEPMGPCGSQSRWLGDILFIVHPAGPDYRGDWGYSVWHDGFCLKGRSSPCWDRERATREAEDCFVFFEED
jgi:hypothetical protein